MSKLDDVFSRSTDDVAKIYKEETKSLMRKYAKENRIPDLKGKNFFDYDDFILWVESL